MRERERSLYYDEITANLHRTAHNSNSLAQVNCHDQQPVRKIHKINGYGGWFGINVNYTFFFLRSSHIFPRYGRIFWRCAQSEKKLCNHNSSAFNVFFPRSVFAFQFIHFCAIWHKNEWWLLLLLLMLCAYAGRGSMLNVKYFIFSSRVSNWIESFRASLFFFYSAHFSILYFHCCHFLCVLYTANRLRASWFAMCQCGDMLGHTFYKV